MPATADRKPPTVLIIMDGVGVAPASPANAVTEANTPCLDKLFAEAPNSELRTDGSYVGLPDGQMGNSEVGHMTIGSGRIILQSLDQISKDLNSGDFENISGFKSFLSASKSAQAVHLVGLMSDGGVHSHIDHIAGIAKLLAAKGHKVYIHCILDGRDTSPTSGANFVKQITQDVSQNENIAVVTAVGRFFGMDRDNRWNRMESAWRLWTLGEGEEVDNLSEGIASQYEHEKTDEFCPPLVDKNASKNALINDGHAVLICNFRADRARQITDLLLQSEFGEKLHPIRKPAAIGTLTEYKSDFNDFVHVIYPNIEFEDTLGDVISKSGRKQLRISETEKYAHVTYYLNCGREEPYENETRILIDSPKEVATYDLKPEMSLPQVTEELVTQIENKEFDLIVLNIANGDQVGHTGVKKAALEAMVHVDEALQKICAALDKVEGQALIIADHGNVEELSVNGAISTAHSTNPVPCIYYGPKKLSLASGGLADVAPTLLELMEISIPELMTGRSLIQ